ncbi:MAG: hypothetical protein ACEY3F_05825, partial [Wolbachia sp.]
MTITSSSRCLLAGSRDTANESRYDGSRWYDVGLLSFQSGMALLHRSDEKNWQLLTKFIINSHLTFEEKICHK